MILIAVKWPFKSHEKLMKSLEMGEKSLLRSMSVTGSSFKLSTFSFGGVLTQRGQSHLRSVRDRLTAATASRGGQSFKKLLQSSESD